MESINSNKLTIRELELLKSNLLIKKHEMVQAQCYNEAVEINEKLREINMILKSKNE